MLTALDKLDHVELRISAFAIEDEEMKKGGRRIHSKATRMPYAQPRSQTKPQGGQTDPLRLEFT